MIKTAPLLCSAVIGVLSPAFLTTARSAVVYSGLRNVPSPASSPQGYQSLPVNLDGRGGPEISLVNQAASIWHFPGAYTTVFYMRMSFIPSLDFVARAGPRQPMTILGADTLIGPDSVFSLLDETTLASSHPSAEGPSGYFGFRFNPSGAQTLYGWGRIISDSSRPLPRGGNIILVDWAYDDSGAPIHAGQIPEPAGTVLLALAGLTVAGFRRRPGA